MLKVGKKLFFGEKFPAVDTSGIVKGESALSRHTPIYKDHSVSYRYPTNLSDASISSNSIYSDQQENITQSYAFDPLDSISHDEEIDIFEFIHEEIIENLNDWDDEATQYSNGVNMILISADFESVNLSSNSPNLPMNQRDLIHDDPVRLQAAESLKRKKNEYYKNIMTDPQAAEKLKQQKSEYYKKRMADPQKANEIKEKNKEAQKKRLTDPQKVEKKRQADRNADKKRMADPQKAERRNQQKREYKERLKIKKQALLQAASALAHIA